MNNISYILRDSYRLRYVDSGDPEKTPIFVIGSSVHYPRLFENEVYKDLHIVYLDHRGFALPENTKDKFNIQTIVEDIEAIRSELNYEKIYLLGHSLNGFLALEYCKKYTKHVLGLILSNLPPRSNPDNIKINESYFRENSSQDRLDFNKRENKKMALDLKQYPDLKFNYMCIRNQAQFFYDYKKDYSYLWKNVDNNSIALDFLWDVELNRYDTLNVLDSLSKDIKIILILSVYDYFMGPISLWDNILKEVDVPLISFEKSGHNPMLEEPERYYQVIKDFMDQ